MGQSLNLTTPRHPRDMYNDIRRALYGNHAGLDRRWWVTPLRTQIRGNIRYRAQYPIALFGGYRSVQTELTMLITFSVNGPTTHIQVDYDWQTSFPINLLRGGMDNPGWSYIERTNAVLRSLL